MRYICIYIIKSHLKILNILHISTSISAPHSGKLSHKYPGKHFFGTNQTQCEEKLLETACTFTKFTQSRHESLLLLQHNTLITFLSGWRRWRCETEQNKIQQLARIAKSIITLPLSTARAAANSDCGTTPFSVPKVFTAADKPDGTEMPCEFSARTKKTYDVAGLSSLICKMVCVSKKKKTTKCSVCRENVLWGCFFFGFVSNNIHKQG